MLFGLKNFTQSLIFDVDSDFDVQILIWNQITHEMQSFCFLGGVFQDPLVQHKM